MCKTARDDTHQPLDLYTTAKCSLSAITEEKRRQNAPGRT